MAVSRKAMTEGIKTSLFPSAFGAPLQSLSLALAGDARASSLYTREPLGAPAPVRLSMVLTVTFFFRRLSVIFGRRNAAGVNRRQFANFL